MSKRSAPATDLVNSMLNYGYAILYARVWQALLRAQLNPYDSLIHVRQSGKPTFVYDVVELFRAQAVDRVVFSLIQKKEPVDTTDGLLSKETKKLLAKNVTERLEKREKLFCRHRIPARTQDGRSGVPDDRRLAEIICENALWAIFVIP